MSTSEKIRNIYSYGTHHNIPETPSVSLNTWLKSRYSVSSNIVQYVVGSVVCAFYEVATALHRAVIRARGDIDPKTMWMASCGLVSVAVALAAWLIFNLIVASSFIIYSILHYAAVITGLAGLGLGAAGALYFSKDMEPAKHGESGVGAGGEYHYRSTTTSSHEYSRSHND